MPPDLPPHPRILVIALRRLGDVLFTTSLIASLRRAFRDAVIDVLVFDGTAGILAGNTDIDRVVTMPQRPGGWQSFALALRLDYAICEKLCVPAQARAELALPSGPASQDGRLVAAEARVPQKRSLGDAGDFAIASARREGIQPVAQGCAGWIRKAPCHG